MANKFITHGESIFNSLGGANDFRVESGNNANMLFVDGGNNRIGMGTNSGTGSLHIKDVKDSGGADVTVTAQNTTSNRITRYQILDESDNITTKIQYDNGGNRGSLNLQVPSAGNADVGFDGTTFLIASNSSSAALVLQSNSTDRFKFKATGEGVFNNSSNDYDFRVESNSSTHALFVDATNGNIGINDSSPSSTLASGISATGRVLSIASGGTTAISIRATDAVNDRNAIIEMLSTGNGGSDNIIVFGDTDTTPATPSGLQLQGYHNGSRVSRWYMDSNAAIYWHKATAGGGWLTAELAKTHLGNDATGTADISFTITFTNSSGVYDNFQVMLYLSLSGNSAPASTSVYEIRGLQRSSAVSIGRTTLVSGESRSITTSTSGLNLTITLASAGSSTATQGAVCRVLGAYYGVSKIVSGNS